MEIREPLAMRISRQAHYLLAVKSYIYRLGEMDGFDEDTLAEVEEQVNEQTASAFTGLFGYPKLDVGRNDPLPCWPICRSRSI